jgi:hypothetical protein
LRRKLGIAFYEFDRDPLVSADPHGLQLAFFDQARDRRGAALQHPRGCCRLYCYRFKIDFGFHSRLRLSRNVTNRENTK